MTREEHIAFLNDSANIRKCDGCPERIRAGNWKDILPCEQYRCWAAKHISLWLLHQLGLDEETLNK